MAKKSTATRQANAARRSQTTAKSGATLVRTQLRETGEAQEAPEAKEATSSTTAKQPKPASNTAAAASAAKPRVAPAVERPRVLEAPKTAKPAPKPEAAPTRQPNTRTQASRVARARATQRARTANIITPEHYAYVLKDLRLIAALAIAMFTVIIILHFVLG